MKRFFLSCFCIVSSAIACYAQTSCDSLYAAEDKFREGKIGLMLWDVPPQVTTGKDRLTNYTGSNDKIGAVMYSVVIDDAGNATCLKFAGTTNKLLVDEANSIAESLRFAPARLRGKGIRSTMYVTVRFYEDKPKKYGARNP